MLKIALDGPGGAGKSTVARAVAAKLGLLYVDTGALYRAIGLYVRRHDIDPKDEAAVTALLPSVTLDLTHENGEQKVYLCGEDVSGLIRTPEISMYASSVSAHPSVRAFLLETQRSIAEHADVIMDGRDIGTVIFPDADVKIFLTATPEDRAQRRYLELREKGQDVRYEDILADIKQRDLQDTTRKNAPLRRAEDAVLLDNSGFEFPQSVEAVLSIIKEKTGRTHG